VTDSRYEIVVTAPAARAIRETLAEAVAFAVIDFITGPLLDNPRRVGAELRDELEGVWSARRGTYRILYRIDDDRREVIILRIGHRKDVYRSLCTIEGQAHSSPTHGGPVVPSSESFSARFRAA
jgi:mRNA interferase RelE/StbE